MKKTLKMLGAVAGVGIMFALSGPVLAIDGSKVSAKKQTTLGLYFTATEAYKYTMDNMDKTLFVDIRTPSELNYLGATTVMDYHVPFVLMDIQSWNSKKHRYKRSNNANFVADVDKALAKKGLTKSDTVILICRSGKRTATAANLLAKNGYKKVYTIVDGYEGGKAKKGENKGKRVVDGWKNSGLPWTYSLDGDLMYYSK